MAIPLDPEPCAFPPGSPEKLDRMAWRMEHGYQIQHPGDARPGAPLPCPPPKIRGGRVRRLLDPRRLRPWVADLYIGAKKLASGWVGRFLSLGCFRTEDDAAHVVRVACSQGVEMARRVAVEQYGQRSRDGEMGRERRYRAQICVGGRLRFIARCATREERQGLQALARREGVERARAAVKER